MSKNHSNISLTSINTNTKGVMVNTSDIVRKLSARANISLQDARMIISNIFSYMEDGLARGEKIEIRGFGTFRVKTRKGSNLRNPKTGEGIPIVDRKRVYFRPSKYIKSKLAQNVVDDKL